MSINKQLKKYINRIWLVIKQPSILKSKCRLTKKKKSTVSLCFHQYASSKIYNNINIGNILYIYQ